MHIQFGEVKELCKEHIAGVNYSIFYASHCRVDCKKEVIWNKPEQSRGVQLLICVPENTTYLYMSSGLELLFLHS